MRGGMERFEPARLAAARGARGLSQSDLAALAGLEHSLVGMLETGARRPSAPVVAALAAALRVPVAELAPLPRYPTLADYRQHTGRAAKQLAGELGLLGPTVSRIETGLLELRQEPEWAALLGIDIDELRRAWERGRRARLRQAEARLAEALARERGRKA